jgi:hypothetical protein
MALGWLGLAVAGCDWLAVLAVETEAPQPLEPGWRRTSTSLHKQTKNKQLGKTLR